MSDFKNVLYQNVRKSTKIKIINKVKTKKKKKIGKNGHYREISDFFGQKPIFFGKNYYQRKLYDYIRLIFLYQLVS